MRPLRHIDRLGLLLAIIGAAAFACLPFVVFKSNRIVPGVAVGFFDVLPPGAAAGVLALLILAAAAALWVEEARLRLAAALLSLIAVALCAAAAGNALTPPGNQVVRIAPGAGCWLLLTSVGLLAADAITRMRPGPLARVLSLAAFLGGAALAFAHGTFDHLSVMREYAINADRFGYEMRRHVELAFGSLIAALLAALPLGILCHRVPRLRGAILGSLNFVQTIPSIALFGILMAPLAVLASAVPYAAKIGIEGIGAAPALVALFLYSLLPIVANTVAGLRRVSPAAVEAARGMGMTGGQILAAVELPLALPVILTGVRIVLVQNIGLVTIAALIGAGGLGTFVFEGIGESANDLVLLGALPTVALAIAAAVLLDALIEVIDRSNA
ncbi:MAG TPA: ABC transporter permease [Steroidobacteraceae bacterium]|nr:ABC transporter permease [Steroidobacteraceae bacterium]